MLLPKPLSSVQLVRELGLLANVVVIDVEEVMNCLAVLLVKLVTNSFEHRSQLPHIYVVVVIDIAHQVKFLVSHASLFQDLKKLKHGSVVEWDIIV